jgi:diaminopimelate decarboxylase
LARSYDELRAKGDRHSRYLDIGGGLGVRYDTSSRRTLKRFADLVLPTVSRTGLQLIMEPGGSSSATPALW